MRRKERKKKKNILSERDRTIWKPLSFVVKVKMKEFLSHFTMCYATSPIFAPSRARTSIAQHKHLPSRSHMLGPCKFFMLCNMYILHFEHEDDKWIFSSFTEPHRSRHIVTSASQGLFFRLVWLALLCSPPSFTGPNKFYFDYFWLPSKIPQISCFALSLALSVIDITFIWRKFLR